VEWCEYDQQSETQMITAATNIVQMSFLTGAQRL